MRNAVRALNIRLILTLALSVATLFLGVPLAAAAGPTVIVAHRGVGGTSTQLEYGFAEESLPAFDWAVEERCRHRRLRRTSHVRQPAGRDA